MNGIIQTHKLRKVFNDILDFWAFCDSYDAVLKLSREKIRIADMSNGKAHDDGYRGVHVYFQRKKYMLSNRNSV